jgi:hypothetical protein
LSLVRNQTTLKKSEKFTSDIIKNTQENYDYVLKGLTRIVLFQIYMKEKLSDKAENILR